MSTGPCPDCFTGTLSSGTPIGTITTIHGLPTYVSTPKDGVKPKGLIVFLADGFGYKLPNNQVLADIYAEKGDFLVYVPDIMGGNGLNPSVMPLIEKITTPTSWIHTIFIKPFLILRAMFIGIPWRIKVRPSITKPRVFEFVQALRTSPPPFPTNSLKIGAAGFCMGGLYSILLAHDTPSSRVLAYNPTTGVADGPLTPLVDCAFAAHPSGLNVPADVDAVTRPLSVAVGDVDMALKVDLVVKMKEILEKKGDDNECVILPGAKHGFTTRTDPKNELQMEHAMTAETQAIKWFTRWLS